MRAIFRRRILFSSFLFCLLMVAVGVQFVVEAGVSPVCSLKMPEEYINYTVSQVNGTLWAEVEGTYPMYIFEIGDQDSAYGGNSGFTFGKDSLPLVYPIPPGSTNISITLNGEELPWSNYTQTHPAAAHHTALGDWPMVSCVVHPVPDSFTLKIHYWHPILLVNGSYAFLYDLNVSPYLSPEASKVTAYFNINFETFYTQLQANTVDREGKPVPVDYMVTKADTAKTVSLQIVSEHARPLPGDLLISFTDCKKREQTNPGLSLPVDHSYAFVAVTVLAAITGYLSLKNRRVRNG